VAQSIAQGNSLLGTYTAAATTTVQTVSATASGTSSGGPAGANHVSVAQAQGNGNGFLVPLNPSYDSIAYTAVALSPGAVSSIISGARNPSALGTAFLGANSQVYGEGAFQANYLGANVGARTFTGSYDITVNTNLNPVGGDILVGFANGAVSGNGFSSLDLSARAVQSGAYLTIDLSVTVTEAAPGDGFSLDWLIGDPPGPGGGPFSDTFASVNDFDAFLADSPVVDLGAGAVPEPSGLMVLVVPLALLGWTRLGRPGTRAMHG
jgi:hypothetical protein